MLLPFEIRVDSAIVSGQQLIRGKIIYLNTRYILRIDNINDGEYYKISYLNGVIINTYEAKKIPDNLLIDVAKIATGLRIFQGKTAADLECKFDAWADDYTTNNGGLYIISTNFIEPKNSYLKLIVVYAIPYF
jgi:hypothetical protein